MENYRTGKLIEALRKEKGLTQGELAKAVGVSKQAVSNWERGTRFPDVVLIEDLSHELGVSPTELIKGEIMENNSVDKNDVSELVCRALKAQRKELGYRWRLITLILVSLTAMLCLGAGYAFWFDRAIIVNFRAFGAFFPSLVAAMFGAAVRYFSSDREAFYKTALAAMAVWIIFETVAAIGFTRDAVEIIGIIEAASQGAWFTLCGLVGAWTTHGIMLLISVLDKKGSNKGAR